MRVSEKGTLPHDGTQTANPFTVFLSEDLSFAQIPRLTATTEFSGREPMAR